MVSTSLRVTLAPCQSLWLMGHTKKRGGIKMLCSDPLCQSCTSSWEAPVTVSHHRGRTLTLWEGCGHWQHLQTGYRLQSSTQEGNTVFLGQFALTSCS